MSEFTDHLQEVFGQFGPVRARKMFGGHGIYHDGLMFALVANDTLYLKVDPDNRAWFDERNLPPFEYVKQGRTVKMSYHLAPEEIFDDPEMAAEWAGRSFEAALRGKRKKPSGPSG